MKPIYLESLHDLSDVKQTPFQPFSFSIICLNSKLSATIQAWHTDRNFVTNYLQVVIYLVLVVHRGALCRFPFRWIYYWHSCKSTGKETGKTHLCALMHLLEISIFSLNNDLVRLTKIINSHVKDLKILSFKVIFQCLKLVKSFQ